MSNTDEMRNAGQMIFDFQDDGNATISEEILGYDASAEDGHAGAPLWIWHDHVIFNEKVKRKFLDTPYDERPQFIIDTLDKFYAKNPEYSNFSRVEVYNDPMLLLNFFKRLTLDDFTQCEIRAAELRLEQLHKLIEVAEYAIARTPINTDKLATFWPILQIRDLFTESEMAALYYLQNPRISGRELARQMGAIGKIGGRQAILSNSKYRGALDQRPNNYAYISYVGPSYWDQIETDEAGNLYDREEARIIRKAREQGKSTKKKRREPENVEAAPEGINKNLAGALFAAMLKTSTRQGSEFTIYLPDFVKEMNKHYKVDVDEYDENGRPNEKYAQARAAEQSEDPAKKAPKNPSIMQDLRSLNEWVGILHGAEVRKILTIVGMNMKANTITVIAPYFEALIRAAEDEQRQKVEAQKQLYKKPNWNWLVHTSMSTERNQAAVDVVVRITNGMLQRGKIPASDFKENVDTNDAGGLIEYTISFESLINEVEKLKWRYNNTKATADKNKLLSRTFTKVYELLKKKTDAYDYFIDLQIPEIIPTTTTLSGEFKATYTGTNPKAQKN